MRYLKTKIDDPDNPGMKIEVDVTGENIKTTSSDSRSLASKIAVTEVTTANTDLNNYKDQGIFYFDSTYKPTNIPVGQTGFLFVFDSGKFIKQFWTRTVSTGTNDFMTYMREYDTTLTTWSNWRQVAFLNSHGAVQNANGGCIGYNGVASNLNSVYTQGQYAVAANTTNAPTTSAGILMVYVGDGSVQDDGSSYRSWCHQVFYGNNGVSWSRYRIKLSGSWSTWKQTSNGHVDVPVTLSSQTWHTGADGMCYTDAITVSPTFREIDSVCIYTWEHLRATDMVMPYISGNKIAIMANNKAFLASAKVTVRVTGSL